MKKLILSFALMIFTYCGISAQESNHSPKESPLEIVKKTYPSATKIVKINDIWNKAVDKRGKVLGYVFNSSEYGKDIRGFRGPVPILIVTDKNQKIRKVTAFNNNETPKYLSKVAAEGLFNKWNGKTIQKAKDEKVDGVTGATFSSRAIIKNVQLISKKAKEKKMK